MRFEAFFAAATGYPPHEYQARIARDGLPGLVTVPPGAGKSAVILAWLWRRLYGPEPDRTPRRLVYALPRRSLTEPLSGSVRGWLASLGLLDEVALHVALGRLADGWGDWREDMHRPAILLGDGDLLVSKALNRGYGTGRTIQPMDFALVGNGAQWIVDEARLCPQTAATLRQLAGLTGTWGTAEPFRLTFLTAAGETGIGAARTIRRAAVDPGDYPALAGLVRAAHQAGTLTLVALGDVAAAQRVGRLLRDGPARCVLLHAQLRGTERAARVADVLTAAGDPGADLIVVSAGEAASGLDLAAALVVAEAAPRPSAAVPGARHEVALLGGDALLALFDTATPGPGIDRYVRDPGEPDVEVAWAEWSQREAGAPDPEVRFPSPEHRCRVPLAAAASLAASRPAWRFDRAAGQWLRVTAESSLHPYDLLLVAAADGGYHPDAGFDPAAPGPVPGCPVLLTPAEAEAGAALLAGGPVATASRGWQSLREHSEQVRDQAAALLAVLRPAIPAAAARAAIVAGYLHDVGKAHPTWQDALCALADESAAGLVAAGRPWAKSGTDGRLEFAGGVTFRHELASLLLIDGPLRSLLAASPDADLTRYLVLAHHGLLRVRVGDPGNPDDPGDPGAPGTSRPPGAPDTILGLAQGATCDIPPLLGQPAAILTVDLGHFRPDGNAADRSWAGTVAGLLDRYGPFTLAYLETVVRVADWRASGGRELPEPVGPRLRSG